MKKLIFSIVLVLLLVPSVCAIGISPSWINVTPGTSEEYTFYAVNNDHVDLYAKVGIELNDEISGFDEFSIYVPADIHKKPFNVTLTIPKNIDCGTVARVYLIEDKDVDPTKITVIGKVASKVNVVDCKKPINVWLILIIIAITASALSVLYVYKKKKKRYYY